MKIIEQSWAWEQNPANALTLIEAAARTCYKSEGNITSDSSQRMVSMLIKKDHLSVLEHATASVRIITNRGVSHELVRHRLCSFSQESTRYVKYDDIEFIEPVWLKDIKPSEWQQRALFHYSLKQSEDHYKRLIGLGWRPEQAREVLPNALKTELVMTCNLREVRHIFKLRTSKKAHPQMRALMVDMLEGFKRRIPIIFDDIMKGDTPME